MLFSSIVFIFRFLPIVLLLYWISPPRLKNTVLLIGSLVFVGWGEFRVLWIISAVILINYISGIILHYVENRAARKCILALAVLGSLSMLIYFKYASFFLSNISHIFGLNAASASTILLPLVISFYTFQSLSYSVDVYRRDVPTERNLINFGAYVTMFPQLIAGPIVRYSDVAERLHTIKNRVTLERIEEGVMLFVFGLAKKALVADGVHSLWADIVGRYEGGRMVAEGIGLANASTPLAWLGILAYALYIFFDFSGYSLMAIGLGKMIGFDFPANFNLPYISRSITEFWQRWHMTLSSWFRDYVYIPLGGNRKVLPRQMVNLLIVWFLTGFWHGANWNFIIWGLYYCAILLAEKALLLKWLEKRKILPHFYTLFLVIVGWAIFASSDPGVGLGLLLNKLFVPQGGAGAMYFLRNYAGILFVGIFFSSGLPVTVYNKIKHIKTVRIALMAVLLAACISYMVAGGYKPFLYFNF